MAGGLAFSSTTGSIDDLLAQKYAILQQQADAGTISANASANAANAQAGLTRTTAGLLPSESAAKIAQDQAQAGYLTANAGLTNQQAKVVVPTSASDIALKRAQAALFGQQTIGEQNENRLVGGLPGALAVGQTLPLGY